MSKKILPLLVACLLLAAPFSAVYADTPIFATVSLPRFRDVPPEEWYAPYIETLSGRGVIDGYEDGTFRPAGTVTWGEALKLILRSAGFAEQKAAEDEHWAEGYLSYARDRGYLPEDLDIVLDTSITRFELADLCAAALELAGAGGESVFADTARESVLLLYEAGVVEGSVLDGVRVYSGTNMLSRAEISAILVRMQDYVDSHFVFVSGFRAPIDFDLRFHSYDPASLRMEEGRLLCDDREQSPRFGIDVSYFQKEIDWDAVAADGIDFAMIRCGYRGYGSEGTLNEDVCFRENIEGALRAGLDVGVYFFAQAVSVEEALEEAEYALELIDGYDITFPVVYDWERLTNAGSRSRSPDWDLVSDCAVAFCDAVAEAGYTPMTYFNKHMSYLQLDMHKMQQYDGWLALYQSKMDYIYDFQMWQYTSNGQVDGIQGRVDLDICFVDYAKQ